LPNILDILGIFSFFRAAFPNDVVKVRLLILDFYRDVLDLADLGQRELLDGVRHDFARFFNDRTEINEGILLSLDVVEIAIKTGEVKFDIDIILVLAEDEIGSWEECLHEAREDIFRSRPTVMTINDEVNVAVVATHATEGEIEPIPARHDDSPPFGFGERDKLVNEVNLCSDFVPIELILFGHK
jgi:hypothetical protein